MMRTLRVVIVEDDGLIAMDLTAMLEDMGHTVCGQADHAEEAVRVVEETRPDLVLLDVMLAGDSNGVTAAAEITNKLGIACMFVSGNIDDALRERVRNFIPPVEFLSKPVNPYSLRQALMLMPALAGLAGRGLV